MRRSSTRISTMLIFLDLRSRRSLPEICRLASSQRCQDPRFLIGPDRTQQHLHRHHLEMLLDITLYLGIASQPRSIHAPDWGARNHLSGRSIVDLTYRALERGIRSPSDSAFGRIGSGSYTSRRVAKGKSLASSWLTTLGAGHRSGSRLGFFSGQFETLQLYTLHVNVC